MADNSRLLAAAVGALAGFWAGRFAPGTNYNGLANLLGTVTPEVVPAALGYGRGHGAAPFIMYDQERRLAGLEAANAANAVAIQKDAQIGAVRAELTEARADGKIYKATCHKIDGKLVVPTNYLAETYRGSSRVLDSHPAGCGDHGHWY